MQVAADTVRADELHDAVTRAFADYLAGPIVLSPGQWPGFLARQSVDLGLSRVEVDDDGRPLAFAFVAPRPALRRWRLASMGAVPEARGQGAAPRLLDDLLARASAAGQAGVELEVFAQNTRALRLYAGRGFVAQTALLGFDGTPTAGVPAVPPRVLTRDAALAWLAGAEARGAALPLQLSAPVLAVAPAWTAWQQGSALLAFGDGPDGALLIRSLVDTDPAQRDAEALVRALGAAHPGRRATMPPLLPPTLGGEALRRAGLVAQPLHQWLMRCTLA